MPPARKEHGKSGQGIDMKGAAKKSLPAERRNQFISWLFAHQLEIAILFCALIFRFYNIFDLGLTHFDEGVYAGLGKLFAAEFGEFSRYSLKMAVFSPPLYSILCGIFFKVFGIRDYIAIAPSMLAGALTCLALFKLGALMDDEKTGLWAAALLIVNPFHIMYSRLALTDALFTFFFVLTVYAGLWAWKNNRWWAYMLAGLPAGLAMNTKYSGFIPLALVIGYWIFSVGWVLVRRAEKPSQRLIQCGLGITAALALFAVLYAPWFIRVNSTMGYGALLKHHRGYSIPFSKAVAAFKSNPGEMLFYFRQWSALPLMLLPFGFLLSFWRWKKEFVVLYAWLIFFYFSLFLYTRYTRLALPLTPAICLLAAVFVSRLILLVKKIFPQRQNLLKRITPAALLIFIMICFLCLYPLLNRDTNAYRVAAQNALKSIPRNRTIIRDNLACMNFYSDPQWVSLNLTQPMRDFLQKPVLKYFIFDEHVTWNEKAKDFYSQNVKDWEMLSNIPINRYEPVWLEPFTAHRFMRMKQHPEEFSLSFNIRIYQTNKPCHIPVSWQ